MDNRILLVDDDQELCELLTEYLSGEGFSVRYVNDGETALADVFGSPPDLLVLDVMMPKLSGIDVLREVRRKSQLPVLMLTARGEETDRIIGLELGADDYLPKPCNPRELAARIKAILRRTRTIEAGDVLRNADIELYSGNREVFLAGEPLDLTSTEFTVLLTLMRRQGSVVRKRDLYLNALGREPVRYDRSIDMHVSNLRRKLGPDESGNDRIETVRGIGYQLKVGR